MCLHTHRSVFNKSHGCRTAVGEHVAQRRWGGGSIDRTKGCDGIHRRGQGRRVALLRSGGAFDKAGNPLLDMSKLSNEQKRLVCEQLFGPNTVKQIVPNGQQIARMQGQGSNGIDELYKVNRPDVDYVNIEYKFVGDPKKVEVDPMNPTRMSDNGSDRLGKTNDGLQGSTTWIGGSNRIEKAVGSLDDARAVRAALESGRVESWVVTVRPDGSTAVEVLDALGKPKPIDQSKIILPNVNPTGVQK